MSIEATKLAWEAAKADASKEEGESRYVIGGNKISVCLYNRNVQMDVSKGTQSPSTAQLFPNIVVAFT